MHSGTRFEAIRSALGEPSFETADCLLYCGDCVELMARCPAMSIDLTVTSPPYNIGKEYEQVVPLPQYLEWSKRWIAGVHRVTRANGAFWLNLGYVPVNGRGRAVPLPYVMWNLSDFYLIQEVIWNYGAGVSSKLAFCPRNEKLLWYVKDADRYCFNLDDVRDPDVKYPKQKKNGKLKCNPLGKNPSDVWQIPKVTSGTNRSSVERMDHPAQFPMALVERIIRACSNPGDVLLDPFMGSGSLAEAALRCGRKVVGFDIKPDYVALSANRLRRYQRDLHFETLQRPLFMDVADEVSLVLRHEEDEIAGQFEKVGQPNHRNPASQT